jgi:hypothetical protein
MPSVSKLPTEERCDGSNPSVNGYRVTGDCPAATSVILVWIGLNSLIFIMVHSLACGRYMTGV